MALTIPVTKNNFEMLEDNMDLIVDKLSDQQKTQIAQFKYEKQQGEEEKKLREVLFRANHPKLAKARDLVTKGWEKLMKTNWFKKVGGFLRNMVSSAGGWLRNILAIITLLNSGILQEMLPWLLQVGATAIKVLIKWTPTILKFVWQILTRMVPQLLKDIFNTVFNTIGLPNDHPIRKFFNYVFDNFPRFADWLLKTFTNIFITLFEVGNKVYVFMKPLFAFLQRTVPGVFASITKFLKESYLPELAEAFGIVRNAFVGLFSSVRGSDKIMGVLKEVGKLLIKALKIYIMFPIYYIKFGKFVFDFFTKTLPSYFKNLDKTIKEFMFKTIPKMFKKAADFIWSPIRDVFYRFVSLFEPISSFLNRLTRIDAGYILSNLESSLSGMWSRITGAIEIPDSVKNVVTGISQGAQEFVKNPGKFINKIFNSLSSNIEKIPNKVLEAVTGVFDWVVAFFRTLGELVSSIDIRNPRKFLSKVSSFTEDLNRNVQEAIAEKKLQKSGERSVSESKKSSQRKITQEWLNWKAGVDAGRIDERFVKAPKKYENRAKGGKVTAGETYMTGEKGTELFTPTEHGNITPNSEIRDMVNLLRKILEVLQSNNSDVAPTFVPLMRSK